MLLKEATVLDIMCAIPNAAACMPCNQLDMLSIEPPTTDKQDIQEPQKYHQIINLIRSSLE
jgi:hypothetical protein